MSLPSMLHAFLRRTIFLCGILLVPLAGCTEFQKVCTANWIDPEWRTGHADQPVTDMITFWDNRMRVTEDSVNGGAPLPGLAGRLLLLNDNATVEAKGSVVVQVFDMTNAKKGAPPLEVGTWTFPALALKKLKKRDGIGDGYTLFLPWSGYHPEVREVKVQVCYKPENGAARYSSPSQVTLQTDDLPPPTIRERTVTSGQDSQRPFGQLPPPLMVPPSPPNLVPMAVPMPVRN